MTNASASFKKLVLYRFGSDFGDSTRIETEARRPLGPTEVLVRVRYAGVNGVFDFNMARNRVAYRKFTVPCDTGAEIIGIVEAVGDDVSGLRPGDAVVHVDIGSGYREYLIAEASAVVRVPAASPEILTLVASGVSGLVALEQAGDLRTGETVVVTAAAGGLGHIVAQLAQLAGNRVIAVTGGARKAKALAALGLDRIVNYREENLDEVLAAEAKNGIDLAYDSVGGTTFDILVKHLAVRGRMVVSGYTADKLGDPEIVSRPRIYHDLYGKGASIRAFQAAHFGKYWPAARARLLALYEAGQIKVLVDSKGFEGLSSIASAVAYLCSGANCGKVVVRLSE